MKWLLGLLFFCSCLTAEDKPVTVRVLLKKLANDAQIEVKGRYLLYNPKTNAFISASNKKKKGKIKTHEQGLFWEELFPGITEIRIVPDEKNCSILVDGLQYKGWIEVYSIGGTINIINEVDTENYLKATISSKINFPLSEETLDALVIAERTHLYYLIEKGAYASWQIEAEKVGYQGLNFNRPVHEAIERTKDLILQYNKKPFLATWGLNHAGRSVAYPSIFRKPSQVPSGVDNLPSLNEREKSKWKTAISLDTLAKIAHLQTVTKIDLFKAEKSQKVYAVRLIGPEGTKDISISDFQKEVGPQLIPSNDFVIFPKGKKAIFIGYGKGLGSGLCLKSAEILAERKASVEKILLTHFPQTNLVNFRLENGLKPLPPNPIWE